MPKVVDHEARQAELVAVAMQLVAETGRLEAASVRAIAARTGWSTGAVRHYLPSAQRLGSLLLDEVAERVQRRVAAEVADPGHSRRDLVARMLEQILPLDDERLLEHRIWIALYVHDPHTDAERAWAWEGQRMFHRQLVLLLAGDETPANYPGPLSEAAEIWAGTLHAVADGLALRIATSVEPVEQSRAQLRQFLAVAEEAVRHETNFRA